MTRKQVCIALLLVVALDGVVSGGGGAPSAGWMLATSLATSLLCFTWYRHDRDERAYARSRWLNVGVIALTPLAIPWYLLRSRAKGERLRAILRLLGFVLLMLLSSAAGQVLNLLLFKHR